MHRINILSVRQIAKLQEQWLELHASVDYNAFLFKKYNTDGLRTSWFWARNCSQLTGPTITLGLATPLVTCIQHVLLPPVCMKYTARDES